MSQENSLDMSQENISTEKEVLIKKVFVLWPHTILLIS